MKRQMVFPSFFPIPESGSCFRDFENICFFKIPLVYVGPTYVTFLQEKIHILLLVRSCTQVIIKSFAFYNK